MSIQRIGLGLAAAGALALSTLVPTGVAQAATGATAGAATGAVGTLACETRDVYISGAEGHWTKCTGTYTSVNGWVKDTRADGKCAQVYSIWTGGAYRESARACPSGTVRQFSWNEYGSASVYLRTIG
jgi:hypothetical protein